MELSNSGVKPRDILLTLEDSLPRRRKAVVVVIVDSEAAAGTSQILPTDGRPPKQYIGKDAAPPFRLQSRLGRIGETPTVPMRWGKLVHGTPASPVAFFFPPGRRQRQEMQAGGLGDVPCRLDRSTLAEAQIPVLFVDPNNRPGRRHNPSDVVGVDSGKTSFARLQNRIGLSTHLSTSVPFQVGCVTQDPTSDVRRPTIRARTRQPCLPSFHLLFSPDILYSMVLLTAAPLEPVLVSLKHRPLCGVYDHGFCQLSQPTWPMAWPGLVKGHHNYTDAHASNLPDTGDQTHWRSRGPASALARCDRIFTGEGQRDFKEKTSDRDPERLFVCS
ncbi:hypothetical protein SODALDRAFT_377962 [Sodiomyces alkalinus F11]|uniref:Uncharacterized protein n=1 Tax=Sodiomyces alkalinus (strain CBS 110278 / VKM F-3762 / F11) TaxID=1314773 RepID=A0A3N2PZZ3_SODAK|nr:hypothetical protein SODALDRAFT_377962 [Sodiomyces alkalinus F11]ROT40084.1 hypothetical protein SODALDRAFT_377962 [Sodiomyces alkalinus F11]